MFNYDTMRYVHLDFHTPGFLEVGAKFNPEEFGETVEKANINTIAIFALCHHGYAYFPSTTGVPHPGLKTDLLGGMTEELKKRKIQSIIYFSQNVNETLAVARPECIALEKDGKPVNSQILLSREELFWSWLCPNRGDWVDTFFLPLIKETLTKYNADGIFLDMAGYLPGSCYCDSCKEKMKAEGLDINNPDHHSDFMVRTNQEVAIKVRKLIDSIKPGLRFLEGSFNRLGDAHNAKGILSEFYLETLPVQVGWFLFPFLARYFRNIGLPVMGLTGRFLKNWGDFGTLKTAHQLKTEVAIHMAAGLPTGVGDHMHFNGQLNKEVYNVIGEAFAFLKERQPYCTGGVPLKETLIPLPKRLSVHAATMKKGAANTFNPMTALTGLSKMITELHYQWDISNSQTDFSQYGAILLNRDSCELDVIEEIAKSVQEGGLLIASYNGLNAKTPEATNTLHKLLGIKKLELLEDQGVYYHMKNKALSKNIPDMPIYTHTPSFKMELEKDVKEIAELILSPCIRSREAFYGHFHGAPDKYAGPAIGLKKIGKGYAVSIAPSLFYSYMHTGHVHHMTLIRNILEKYFPKEKRKAKTTAPGIVELTLSENDGNIILQAVPFISSRRHAESFEVLNDVVAVHGTKVSINAPFPVSKVIDPVKNKEIKFKEKDGWVSFKLPDFTEHFTALIVPQK